MSRTNKIIEDHKVIEVLNPSPGNYFLTLQSPVEIPAILPGNFAEIKVPDAPDVFLRRPFSILDVDYKNRLIRFYVKVIGKGTKKLGELNVGDQVSMIYPLGNSYTLPQPGHKALIVGGGSGIAPFILLGKALIKNSNEVTFLIGGRSKQDVLLINELSSYGAVLITTEDGSLGERGLVTEHSVFRPDKFKFDKIYTCGPDPMMKAVGDLATAAGIDCEASLENMMACGFGICLCCITPTQEGNKRVCWDGPVFNVNYLKWHS
ncbi:MAG: dihydroorotate dehydrogenase electron transfer subunit [Bacteroidetes bacterium]|nr:dihydroorotate dehydrogenase electron transfer subunit [Bacteroidota bacterium]